jgi:cell fate regulator YaaT (PSP1 superfamily)
MVMLTQVKTADPSTHVLAVSFMKVGKLYYFHFFNFPDLEIGDQVIVQTRSLGLQMGKVKAFRPRSDIQPEEEIQSIFRPATPADLLLSQQWQEREMEALIECREKAKQQGDFKDLKFVVAEYNFDGSVLTYLYTCEDKDKVNTTRLRWALQRRFRTRVEFRQIGPRDVARLQEGFGACGIPRCCSTFLTEFSMISVNMAKAQGISLNPAEITGMCGRLRCCLIYEYEQYVEARKQLPRIRKRVGISQGVGRVIEVHPLEDAVTVMVDEGFYKVKREELIPADEWDALRAAAASPCSKNESGGCDCGARRPRRGERETLAELGVASDLPSTKAPARPPRGAPKTADRAEKKAETSASGEQEQKGEHYRRNRRDRRRRRGGGGNKPTPNKDGA